ncbi:MAG: M16 family metallopeptidase [Planctomycetota bacterium]
MFSCLPPSLPSLLTVCLLFPASLFASARGSGQAVSEPVATVTDAGLRIWQLPGNPGSGSFHLVVLVGVGSRHEPAGKGGIAHFLEHCMFLSSEGESARQRTKTLREHDGVENGSTTKDTTAFQVSVPARHWDFAVRWMAEMITRPALVLEEVDAERKIVYEEVDVHAPGSKDPTVETILYPDHPLGGAIAGDVERYESISRQDLRDFYETWYRSGNIVVAFSGRVPERDCVERIEAEFAALEPGSAPGPSVEPTPFTGDYNVGGNGRFRVPRDAKGQLVAGFHVRERSPENLASLLVLRSILGERFMDRVRSELRLAYAPSVDFWTFADAWRLEFSSTISRRARLPEMREAFLGVIAELDSIDARELERARKQARASLLVSDADQLARVARQYLVLASSGAEIAMLDRQLESLELADVQDLIHSELVAANRYIVSNEPSGGVQAWHYFLILLLVVLAAFEINQDFPLLRRVVLGPCRAVLRNRAAASRRRRRRSDADLLENEIHDFYEAEDRMKRRQQKRGKETGEA